MGCGLTTGNAAAWHSIKVVVRCKATWRGAAGRPVPRAARSHVLVVPTKPVGDVDAPTMED